MNGYSSVEILDKLVGFESVSHRSNLDIAGYVRDLVVSLGGRVERFRSPDDQKEALLIAFGPPVEGGIVLSGHMDVVPVTDQIWTSHPFRLRQADNRFYGRGAVDMKGFLALALSSASSLDYSAMTRPLYLAFSYDEEVTCEGVKPIVAFLKEHAPRPSCVIVGEPTEMRIVGAHKGAVDWRIQVKGQAAHSSLPHLGSNAIHAAAQIVALIDQIAESFTRSRPPGSELFDVPFSTVSVGLINGGSAPNVIPALCELHLEARPLVSGDDIYIMDQLKQHIRDSVLPRLRKTAANADVTVIEVDSLPPLVRDPSSNAERLVKGLLEANDVEAVSYATEAGFFQSAGFPTVVFGPGSIRQAHQPDEYISMSQFEAGENFLRSLVQTLY
ncbi:acetylornithine deacetylase [Rhizobium sp. CNPSo 3968]|uniref:acetylornithine deacetylase n=1 Tax=Rhizobium sp. CNPSo 3968 TaxID=3021408 RepID=UPI000DDCF438|nr:acetylornithine deacetylase [Rhizobium sp. CNPSo 3968]MDK4717861.1 acetylornithine deacetylase [Rhizobium sp. CNPSo 3968]